MYFMTLSFLVLVFLPQKAQQDVVIPHSYRLPPITPYHHICPGVDNLTENFVSVGVMLSIPSAAARLNISQTTLAPGDLFIPLSSIARAAFKQATIINQEGALLPNHSLCLFFTFVPDNLQDTSLGSNYLYAHSGTYLSINGVTDPYQFRVNRDLMVSFGNAINVVPPPDRFQCPVFPYAFNATFCNLEELQYDSSCELGVFNTNIDIHFTSIQLLNAAKSFMRLLGWKRYGIFTTCTNQEVWQLQDQGLFLSQYTGGNNFLKDFQLFQENEISVILFVGTICSYFDFLIQSYNYGLVRTGKFTFVTVIQDFNPNSFLTKSLTGMCGTNFTLDELLKIKQSINKTIVIYPRCICRYGTVNDFLDPGLSVLDECMQLYMSDAVTLSAKASSEVLKQKSKDAGVDVSLRSIEKTDYVKVTEALFNSSFFGRSGMVQFDKACHRVANVYAASNILIKEDSLTARVFDGTLDIKAYVLTRSGGLDDVTFVENETDVNTNTFLFQDNTKNVPRDSPKRHYFRNNVKVVVTLFMTGVAYIIAISIYIICVYYNDRKALKYSENWLVEQKDLNPVGVCGMFPQSWQAEKFACPALDGSITQVYNNSLVQVYKCDISLREVTNSHSIRKDILQTMELSHSNLCSFNGCVSNNSKVIGIMFEHTARKNVYELLTNPYLDLNESNRNTFCQDIINGLQYLHSKKICHGRLRSINCLIDENWNIKLTNFGVHSLYRNCCDKASEYKLGNTIALDWKAPECRLLACFPSMKADVYSLGALLKEIACRQSVISINTQRQDIATRSSLLVYDDDVPILFKQLVENCLSNCPKERPTVELVKIEMRNILSLEQKLLKNEGFGTLEMYSSNLEKQVELAQVDLENERELSDITLSNYIPETVVCKARRGVTVPVRVHRNVTLLFVQLNQFNDLFNKYTSDVASGIISNIDNLLINVSTRYQLERVQYNGSMWVYVGGVYNSIPKVSAVIKVVKAALEILTEFQEQQDKVTVTLALHSGALLCGLMNETNQVHVTAGDTFHEGLRLTSLAPAMRVNISEELMKRLDYYKESRNMFIVEKYKSFTIDNGEVMDIYQVIDDDDDV